MESEQILQELNKKYQRSHKNMMGSIEAYKTSFTNVTLIYNNDERIKRYATCENNFKAVEAEHANLLEKVKALNKRKACIIEHINELREEFAKVVKMIGSKVIGEVKNFFGYYCATNKNIVTFLAEHKYNLERMAIEPFFITLHQASNPQFFSLP
jgi:predicted nuclease with TOPRIM domain